MLMLILHFHIHTNNSNDIPVTEQIPVNNSNVNALQNNSKESENKRILVYDQYYNPHRKMSIT